MRASPLQRIRLLPPLLRLGIMSAVVLAGIPAAGQDVDVTPPLLVDLFFAPAAIDVSAGSQTVAVTMHATDDLAGVSSLSVTFRSPSFVQFQFASTSTLSAGTPMDGTFVGTVVFPQFAEAGTWVISSVVMTDRAGNSTSILTDVLASRGFPTTLDIASTPDTSPPALAALSLSPAVLDVSAADVPVTVALRATDDLSGVAFDPCIAGTGFNFFPVTVRSPSGAQQRFTWSTAFTLGSGTRADGDWTATFTMPQFSEPGQWSVESLNLRDCAGNSRSYNAAALQALGITPTFDVVSTPADTQPPVLVSLSYLPIAINTSTGSQSVTVRLGIQDDLAGAAFTPTTPQASFFEGGVQFRSPSGNQVRAAAFFGPFTLVSGTALNGIWQGVVSFPQFSEDGTWRIDLLQVKDRTRNITRFDTAGLAALGLPTTLEVLRPSLESDGVVGAGGGTVTDDTFGDRAQLVLPAGAVAGPTDVAIDVFLEPLDIPTPTGFTGPGTLFVNIQLTPEPAYPLPPPGMTVVLPLPNPMPAGTVLWLFKVDDATGSLVPAVDVFGNSASGTVGADGLRATFSGIGSLSTVVGLIPDALAVAIDIKPGEDPNTVNLASRGATPVAILSSAFFDARTVQAETVRLAGAGPRRLGNGRVSFTIQDVNGDGRADMVLKVETQDLALTSSDAEAVLTGETLDGTPIIGRDAVRIVP